MTKAWILIWTGYYGVHGLSFETKEACRTYGIAQVEMLIANSAVELPRDFRWYCEEVVRQGKPKATDFETK